MNQQPILPIRFTRPCADLPTRAHPTGGFGSTGVK